MILKTPPHLIQINLDCHCILSLLNLPGVTFLYYEKLKRSSAFENELTSEKVILLHRTPAGVKKMFPKL